MRRPDRVVAGLIRSPKPADAGSKSGTASNGNGGVAPALERETAVQSQPHSRESNLHFRESDPHPPKSDGGQLLADGGKRAERAREREQPLSERSRRSLETEIDDLEQDLEQYETQDQAVIDRYEGLLAERQRRQRRPETEREDADRQRLERIKNQVLRAFGLR